MKHRISAVFADIDGTLYSHTTNCIPDSALRAIEKARNRGIPVFAATGRHMLEVRDLNMDVELDGWITMNGALCFNEEGIFSHQPISPGDLKILLEHLKQEPFPCQFMEKDLIYINMYDERVEASLAAIHTPYPPIIDPVRSLGHETYLITPWVKDEVWKKVYADMKELKYTRWNDLAIDAMHAKTGKKNGVLAACRHFGIDPLEALAVGDGPNDIELFEACAYSAAMGNSLEEVKKAADYTGPDIDEDGFEKILGKYIFK